MNVLVPGGCGYIGAWLIPFLLADGHKVTVYDTQWFGDGYLPDNDSLQMFKADVRAVEPLSRACDGQDAVICLASISAEEMCRKNTKLARTVNLGGMSQMARMAKRYGVKRFIFASSVAAYGSSDRDAIETDELKPTTIYGECKRDGEALVMKEFPKATIIRAASVCGYSTHQRFDLTVNMMTHDAVRKGRIVVNGGEQKRSHVHMKDITQFYRQILSAPLESIAGQVFNVVASNEPILTTAKRVASVTGAEVEIRPRTDDRSYTADGSKARDVLGFTPSWTIEDAAMDLFVRLEAGYWPDSLTNPVYRNVAEVAA